MILLTELNRTWRTICLHRQAEEPLPRELNKPTVEEQFALTPYSLTGLSWRESATIANNGGNGEGDGADSVRANGDEGTAP